MPDTIRSALKPPMKDPKFTCCGLFLLVALLATSAHAEVLELEGTVKSVDAAARTLSVERKTPKGTKTLELEVTKKAGKKTAKR